MFENLGDPVLPLLKKSLDANWLRQQVIDHNIANASTPHYKRWDLDFGKILQEKAAAPALPLARTQKGHLGVQQGGKRCSVLVRDEHTSLRNDGNNVDLESEMALQAANLLQYNLLTRLASDQLGLLRTAITEGRR